MSLNEATLIGNVVREPEIRRTQSGKPVASFTLATNETWRDKATGERKERAEFHRIVVFSEGLCSVIEKYVRKGSKLFIRGSIQTRKWQDQSGADRYSTEIVLQGFNANLTMLDGRGGASDGVQESGQSDYGEQGGGGASTGGGTSGGFDNRLDDEIPF